MLIDLELRHWLVWQNDSVTQHAPTEHLQTPTQQRELKIFIFAECFPYSIIVFLLLTLIALASYSANHLSDI